jgi:Asp/Glu/hydantoin racemase
MRTRIALIHAVTVAMDPVQEAFRRLWPQALCTNLLDDSLSADLERDKVLTREMTGRFLTLAAYCAASGAEGILFTCSAFGEAIEAAGRHVPIPVLKPNAAMFETALAAGRRIGMLATFEPSVASMEAEFQQMAADRQSAATLETYCVPGAMAALKAGNPAEHDRLIAEAAPRFSACDAVLLAHFSTARAAPAVASRVSAPGVHEPGQCRREDAGSGGGGPVAP